MNRIILLNVSLLFLGVTYTVAVDVKKALTERSRLTVRAVIDPSTNVTLIPMAGDATSQLFGECLASSRRVVYKPSAVVSPSTGFTYWRYELGGNGKNSGPSTWDKVLNVDDIFDCADAAADYRLFRFEGKKCSLSNKTFLEDKIFYLVHGHPEGNKDVIFINFEIPPSSCVGNFVIINGTCVNIVEFETPLDSTFRFKAKRVCGSYASKIYYKTDALPLSTVQNYLRTNKITGEFLVGAYLNKAYPRVEWSDSYNPVDLSFVDASSYANYENKAGVVISSNRDYKLVVYEFHDDIRGVICAPDL